MNIFYPFQLKMDETSRPVLYLPYMHGKDYTIMAKQNTGRITWIDGLKGIACLLIFTHHFGLEYFPCSYYGPQMESRLPFGMDIKLSYEPYGILVNGNFWVCVFITLAAFLAAFSVLRYCDAANWQERISGIIVKRYVRLLIPCGTAGVLYWLLREYLAPHFARYQDLQNPLSFVQMLWHTFVKMWIVADTDVSGLYWMLYIIFLGTFIAIILALAVRYSKKWVCLFFFLGASLLLWAKDEYYLCVVFGVLLAYFAQTGLHIENRKLRFLGLLPLVAGIYLGGYPSGTQPVFFYRYLAKLCSFTLKMIPTYHVLGAGLLILGIILCAPAQRALSAKPLRWLGSVSMGIFTLHAILIQFAGRPLRDLFLSMGMGYPLMTLSVWLILCAILLLLAWGFKHTVERFCDKVLSHL